MLFILFIKINEFPIFSNYLLLLINIILNIMILWMIFEEIIQSTSKNNK